MHESLGTKTLVKQGVKASVSVNVNGSDADHPLAQWPLCHEMQNMPVDIWTPLLGP